MISKKGYVLTLDVTIGLIIVLGLLTMSAIILNNAQSGTFLELQQVRVANDVITVMDERDILQSYNSSLINTTLYQLLPYNFQMYMVIKHYRYDPSLPSFIYTNMTTVGQVTNQTNSFIGQGRRTFVKTSGVNITNYSTVDYNIWVQ